jgi:hypothetical protein
LGGDGIAVTAVGPGLTHILATADIPAAEFADAEARQALSRPLTPEDTAAVVAMLAHHEEAALTGRPCAWMVVLSCPETAGREMPERCDPGASSGGRPTTRHPLVSEAPRRSHS